VLATAPAAVAAVDSERPRPLRRFALVIGAHDGGAGRSVLRFAGTDAAAMEDVLDELGGVDRRDRALLIDPDVQGVREAIERFGGEVARARAQGARTELVVYYSGHSDESGLLLGAERLDYAELRARIDAIAADVRIVVLDSCASGAFTRLKGGKRQPAFAARTSDDVRGHAFLTSASSDEDAQESDRIGGSFFTHYLVSGLRGAADSDGDRRVSLDEAYAYAFDATLERTAATFAGPQHPSYEIALSGTGDLVMTDLRRSAADLGVTAGVEGRVFVRDAKGQLVAEIFRARGSAATTLALEPGSYTVIVDDGITVRQARVTLREGTPASLRAEDLREIPREATTSRGSVGPPPGPAAPPGYVRVPFDLGLFPGAGVNAGVPRGTKVINHFALSLLVSDVARIEGIQLGTGAGITREHLLGAQLHGYANVSQGTAQGLQATLLYNGADVLRGAQISAGVNASVSQTGVQAGLVNVSERITGLQLGAFNLASRRGGALIGLINVAGDADVALGLVSIVRAHGVGAYVGTSDLALIEVGARFRARYSYSFLELGVHPLPGGQHWSYGFGLGARIPVPAAPAWSVDVDLGAFGVQSGFDRVRTPRPLGRLRAVARWRPRPHFALYGGLTLQALGEFDLDAAIERPGYPYRVARFTDVEGGRRVDVWPGFTLGLEF
jgi:hypothetical protein